MRRGGERGASEAADVRAEAVSDAVEGGVGGAQQVGEGRQLRGHGLHHPRHRHAHVPRVRRSLVVVERICNIF